MDDENNLLALPAIGRIAVKRLTPIYFRYFKIFKKNTSFTL